MIWRDTAYTLYGKSQWDAQGMWAEYPDLEEKDGPNENNSDNPISYMNQFEILKLITSKSLDQLYIYLYYIYYI